MKKKFTVYMTDQVGDGCYKHIITVNIRNIIEETPDTLTVMESDPYDDDSQYKMIYYTDINKFESVQTLRFQSKIQELNRGLSKMLEMANKLSIKNN